MHDKVFFYVRVVPLLSTKAEKQVKMNEENREVTAERQQMEVTSVNMKVGMIIESFAVPLSSSLDWKKLCGPARIDPFAFCKQTY